MVQPTGGPADWADGPRGAWRRNTELRWTIDRAFEGKVSSIEFEADLPGKGSRSFSSDIIPQVTADGEIDGYYVMTRDVTKRHRAEQALVAGEARLRAIYETAGVGIALADATGRFTQYNPAFRAMLGYDKSELIGRSFRDITHSDDMGSTDDRFEKLRTGLIERHQLEKRYLRKDGSVCWVDMHASALHDQDGQFEHVLAVIKDITAQREAVESLMNEVAERKHAEAQLKRQADETTSARVAAESAARAKSEFLANMSHEIRTPMNGVLGMADLLAQTELNDVQRRHLSVIRNSGKTLLNVINDILDISKLEAGKLRLENMPFDLRGVVNDVVELFLESASSGSVLVSSSVSGEVPHAFYGDPNRLRQILGNLVSNAVKFTTGGEAVSRSAHTLKSSSADIGAMAFSEKCKQIERWAACGDLESIRAELAHLRSGFEDVRREVERLRAA